MQTLNLALLQMNLVWESPQANRDKVEAMLSAATQAPDLIVLPEMFTTGFTMQPEGKEESMDGPTLVWMQTLAKAQGALVTGSLIIREGEDYFNRLVVVSGRGLEYQYDKRHLFRMAGEHNHYNGGEQIGTFSCKGWRICPLICYDLRFPVWSRNRLKSAGVGYDLLLYVANWPEVRVSHWNLLLRARAVENQAYVAGVNRIGTDGNNIAYSGDSAVIDPLGVDLYAAPREEQLISLSLDPEPLIRYREKFPAWQDADPFRVL